MNILSYLLIIAICVFLQGFFAGLEIALLSCNRIQIRHLADQGHTRARWVDAFLARPVDYLSTTMIGVNVAIVIQAAIATHLASYFFRENVASLVATGVLWPMILLFGEFMPMSIALAHPLKISLWSVIPLKMAYFLFYPAVRLIEHFSNWINRSLGGQKGLSGPYFTRDELRLLFKGVAGPGFDKTQEHMIHGVFEFHKLKVHEIMVPLKEVVSSSVESTVGHLKGRIFDSAFSRIPLFKTNPQHIVGTVHAMDLMGLEDELPIERVMKPPFKVSQTKTAAEVLSELKAHQRYMAIVVDAKDHCVGIVTMEDILEEIVGEIEDEYDEVATA